MAPDELLIISVKAAKQKDFCIVSFDDGSFIKLHIDLIAKSRLKKGIALKAGEISALIGRQRIADAKLKAFKYAAGKNKTEFMIAHNLRQKGFTKDETEAALNYLKEYNVMDDMEFCKSFIRIHTERKASGKMKIMSELMRKGVARDIAQKAIEIYFPEENQLDMALKTANKKMRLLSGKPAEKRKTSLINSLRNAGFPESIIRQAVEQVYGEMND